MQSTAFLDQQSEKSLENIKNTTEALGNIVVRSIDSIPIGICITDRHGYFLNVNTTYCDIYGYSKKELIGEHFTVVVPEEGRPALDELHKRFMGRKYELQGRWKVLNREGHTFLILSSAAYLVDEETGEPQKMTFVVDLTNAQRAYEELQATIEVLHKKLDAQDAAIDIANHDVKNNVNSMMNISDILLSKEPTEEQRKWLERLKHTGEKTLTLLKTASDYAQMEQGKYKPDIGEFDLLEIIDDSIVSLARIVDRKNLQLKLKHPDDQGNSSADLLIQADKFYLERVLHNLLQNAVEASPDGKTVTVEVTGDEMVQIDIHNEGMIPTEIQPYFFEKYITAGKRAGTGLGTYIAKLVVEMHQGSVAFRTSEEYGTHIYLSFPKQILIN